MMRRPAMPLFAKVVTAPFAGVLMALWAGSMGEIPLISKSVDVELPQVSSWWPDVWERQIGARVGVTRIETVFFNGRKMESDGELDQRLSAHFRNNGHRAKVVYLKADIALPFEVVDRLAVKFQRAGATNMVLLAEPRFEEARVPPR